MAIGIFLEKFPQTKHFRFCCQSDVPSEELVSALDMVLINLYTQYGEAKFELQYRYGNDGVRNQQFQGANFRKAIFRGV